jgi:exonuclease SbcC
VKGEFLSMNAIDTILIENFQCHEKTIVKLAPNGQLTIITGQTNSGKTAIFRAIKWFLYNTPQGSDFIRAGCTFCQITFNFESGHTVIREMTPSKNQYRIVVPGAEKPVILEGFGRSVPVEVQDITGVRPVIIGDNKYNLNMAEQLDGPFLGSSISAPDRAKILGKLAGTEILDYAGKQAGTDIYRQTQNKEGLEADIKQLGGSIATYDYLPGLASKIMALERIVADIKTKQERLNSLKDSLQRLNQIDINICCCNITLDRWKNVDTAAHIVTEVTAGVEKAAKLAKHQVTLSALQSGITKAQATIKRLEHVAIADKAVLNADFKLTKLKQLISLHDRVNLFETAINGCNTTINRLGDIEKAEAVIQTTVTTQERLNQLINSCLSLNNLARSIGLLGEKVEKLIGINRAESTVSDISVKLERLHKLQFTNNVIKPLTIAIEDRKKNIIQWEQRLTELDGKYHDELTALGVCPLCGSILGKKAS